MAPTFIQVLTSEVARMQHAHPDREGEIGRASALITLGMVHETDNPNEAQVLSSDGKTLYTVNGQCSCQAGQHGRDCKHMHAWKLFKHVQRKMAPATPEPPVAPLPEARASLNFKAMVRGFETQITLRSDTEDDLLERLQALITRTDITPVPKPVPRQSGHWKGRQYQGRS